MGVCTQILTGISEDVVVPYLGFSSRNWLRFPILIFILIFMR